MHSLLTPLSTAARSLALSFTLAMPAVIALHTPATASPPPPAALAQGPLAQFSALSPNTPKLTSTLSFAKANVYAGEFSIAGVTLNSTREDVMWMLGSPKSSETLPGSFIDEILYYGGISISFAGGQVWDIISTSPKFCTPSGVCPGDSVSRVFNTLGPTDIVGQSAIYTASGMGSCVLDLGIAYNAVSQIKLVCQ